MSIQKFIAPWKVADIQYLAFDENHKKYVRMKHWKRQQIEKNSTEQLHPTQKTHSFLYFTFMHTHSLTL
jgi:hypothetical protein